mgnify:CR=1 FL=1
MIRVQTETRVEMMCIIDAIKEHCDRCKHEIQCNDCNYKNITYELIDLYYSKPVKRWDFSK